MIEQLDIGACSIAGMRQENQDSLAHFETPFGYVFIVADGMGGYEGGSVASQLAVSRFPLLLAGLPETISPEEALEQAAAALNDEIYERANGSQTQSKMGSTLALLVIRPGSAGLLGIAAHVGDSRVYFCRAGQLFCLTRDHTVVQELVASGALNQDQADAHPQSHVLTRALGHSLPLRIDISDWLLLRPGDLLLLCSDGLSGYVPDAAIRETLLEPEDAGTIAGNLVRLALREGSSDNISTAVVRIRNRNSAV